MRQPRITVTLRIPKVLHKEAIEMVKRKDTDLESLNDLILRAIRVYVSGKEWA